MDGTLFEISDTFFFKRTTNSQKKKWRSLKKKLKKKGQKIIIKSGEGFLVIEIFKGKEFKFKFDIKGKSISDPIISYYKEFMGKIKEYLKRPPDTF